MSEQPEEYGNTQHKVVDKSKIRGRLSYTEQVLGQLSIWLEKLRHDETLSSDLRTQASMMLDDVWQALRDIHEPTNGLKAILSSMFLPGDIVHHPKYGNGIVIPSTEPDMVTVQFGDGTKPKTLNLAYAKLEKVKVGP